MAYPIVTYCALLLCVAVSAATANLPINSPKNAWDNADRALYDFTTLVTASVDEAHENLDQLENQLLAVAAQTFEDGAIVVGDIIDRIDAVIQELRNNADDSTTTTVERCIGQYINEINRLEVSVNGTVINCITNLQNRALNEIGSARGQVSNALNVPYELRLKIEDCNFVADSQDCISRMIIEILLQSIEVPSNIQEVTLRTTHVVRSYHDEFPLCLRDRLSGANLLVDAIIKSLLSCAQ